MYTNKNAIKPVELNCGHTFHPECIKEWFYRNESCPLCRAEISDYKFHSILDNCDLSDRDKFLYDLYDKGFIFRDRNIINKYLLITDKFRDYIYNSFNYESFVEKMYDIFRL
tara:strand:- start:128 stop:463 length:336 start_codon:yes stop_codon:yes gene_type:complete